MRRAIALLVLGLTLAGCAHARYASDRGELIRSILASTVQLRAEREGGARRAASGVVIAADPVARRAWVITAKHFVHPPATQDVFVRQPGSRRAVQGAIAAVSPTVDLAIIEVAGLDLAPARLQEAIGLGDDILVVAFPWGRRFTVIGGVVSQIASPEGKAWIEGPARMVDASVSYGSSGGGVFDAQRGTLIGIVEGYRTAKVAMPQAKDGAFEVPVAGETTVIPAPTILRFVVDAGLGDFLAR